MRQRIALGFVCATWLGLALPAAAQEAKPKAAAPAVKVAEREEVRSASRLLEAWIETQMAYRGLPGLTLAVVHDQELVWVKGFGQADLDKKTPASPSTIYRIASISKLFTAVAVLQLRDQGKLKLDDPVEKYLPWFKVKTPHADAQPITVRQLLMHTSGLPREAAFPYWTDFKFPSRKEMIDALPAQEAVYPPDTQWKYSNLGLALAGEIVVAVSGQTFEDYVQKHIFDPLGMKSSSVSLPEAHKARLATGYGRRLPDGKREIRPFTDAQGIAPAAGLATTAEDLARFVSLQFRDGPAGSSQILKGSTLREMHRVHWLLPDWKSGRGLGFHIIHRDDGDLVGHGGWVAGYQSSVYFRPKDKVAVIALYNADDGLPYPGSTDSVVDRTFQWVGAAIAKSTPAAETPKARPEWQQYVGKYRSPWADNQVLVMDGKLVLINPTEHDPTGTLATLVPTAEHQFRIEGGAVSGPHGELVTFEMKDGKVARLKIGVNYANPLK